MVSDNMMVSAVSGGKVGVSVVSGAGLVCVCLVSDGRLVYPCGVSTVPSGRLVCLCCVRKYVVYTSILVCLWWCLVEG